jgi:hypothetical protein
MSPFLSRVGDGVDHAVVLHAAHVRGIIVVRLARVGLQLNGGDFAVVAVLLHQFGVRADLYHAPVV